MRRLMFPALLAALLPQATAAHVVRHNAMPAVYWGTWAPAAEACRDGDKTAFVLAAKRYVGPAGSCAIASVSETPTPNGAMYSARMECPGKGAQAKKITVVNLIIRSDKDDQISVGPSFENLTAHRRCSAGGEGAK